MSISSLRAAYKICELSDWTISNIKLQKILYLANMVYLYRHKKPLLADEFVAWKYGPVLPILYDRVKRFGSLAIEKYVFERDLETIDDKTINNFLEEAYVKLNEYSVSKLISITHRNKGAWESCYQENQNNVIPNQLILEEYESLLNDK